MYLEACTVNLAFNLPGREQPLILEVYAPLPEEDRKWLEKTFFYQTRDTKTKRTVKKMKKDVDDEFIWETWRRCVKSWNLTDREGNPLEISKANYDRFKEIAPGCCVTEVLAVGRNEPMPDDRMSYEVTEKDFEETERDVSGDVDPNF